MLRLARLCFQNSKNPNSQFQKNLLKAKQKIKTQAHQAHKKDSGFLSNVDLSDPNFSHKPIIHYSDIASGTLAAKFNSTPSEGPQQVGKITIKDAFDQEGNIQVPGKVPKVVKFRSNDFLADDISQFGVADTTSDKNIILKHDMKGQLTRNTTDGVPVSKLEGMDYPYLADKPSNALSLKGKATAKKLLAKHQTMSDPIWHLTGGRYATDGLSHDEMRDFGDFERVRYGWIKGLILFVVLIKVFMQVYSKPDEKGVEKLPTVNYGSLSFNLDEEIVLLKNREDFKSYGKEMLKSSTYRKVLKSECLKKHGLEDGTKIFEELVYYVTGSYDYCHKTVIEPRNLEWDNARKFLPNM